MPNVALDILVNVVINKILLIFISLSSLVFIFVLVLVSSTIIQNVFVIFVIVDEKNTDYSEPVTSIHKALVMSLAHVNSTIASVCSITFYRIRTKVMHFITLPSQIPPVALLAAGVLAAEFSMSSFHLHTAQYNFFELGKVI